MRDDKACQKNNIKIVNEQLETSKVNDLPDFSTVVNFFALLQKVDMRLNPQNYQPKKDEDARYNDTVSSKA
jgi:hypothetical protein